jgi:hypothetical protein
MNSLPTSHLPTPNAPMAAILPRMHDRILEMAKRSFGYGRWEAPYWFIGPEQGMGPHENGQLGPRVEAWLRLGGRELCDCREFHALIGEERWHRQRPRLQPTWRPLLLLLATVLDTPIQNDALRRYQRDHWGTLNGETCAIELSGLAAPNLMAPGLHGLFLDERVGVIRDRIQQYKPKLVVMYGNHDLPAWETIAAQPFPQTGILSVGPTVLVTTPHPVSHGSTNEYWTRLGLELRRIVGLSCMSGC